MSPARRRTLAVFALLVAAVCTGLGVWQLDRLDERRAEVAERRARLAAPAVRLGVRGAGRAGDAAGTDARLPPPESLAWRGAEARGRFAYEQEVLLAPRSWSGSPAVYLLTPLLLDDSTAVPVLRGAVPAPDGFHAPIGRARPQRPEDGAGADAGGAPGPVETVRGLLLPDPGSGPSSPTDTLHAAGGVYAVLARLDLARVDSLLPWHVLPLYLHAESTSVAVPPGPGPPLPIRVPPPELDDGPHLSYAIQWFSFAAIALVGGAVVFFHDRSGASESPPA